MRGQSIMERREEEAISKREKTKTSLKTPICQGLMKVDIVRRAVALRTNQEIL
jgi:hypothetical protein